jgi:hypothetical protein
MMLECFGRNGRIAETPKANLFPQCEGVTRVIFFKHAFEAAQLCVSAG